MEHPRRRIRSQQGTAEEGMVKSAYRTLDLLELLAYYAEGLTFTEITERLGLPKSTVFQLLQTLSKRKYIVYSVDNKAYRLGTESFVLSARVLSGSHEIRHAEQVMERVAQEFGENTKIAVLSGNQIAVIREIKGVSALGHKEGILSGEYLPWYTTALGKALLCRHRKEQVRELWDTSFPTNNTPKSAVSWENVWKDIEETALFGLAFEAEEHEGGTYCISIPLLNQDGEVSFSIGIELKRGQTTYERLKSVFERMLEIAQEINPKYWTRKNEDARKCIYWSFSNLSTAKAMEYMHTIESERQNGELDVIVTNCHDDEWKQQLFLELAITRLKPECVIIAPVNAVQSDVLFRFASQHQIPTICFQRPTRSRYVEYYVGGDGFNQGKMQMEYVARRLKGRGKVAIIEGDPYNDNARNNVLGSLHEARQHPGIQIILSAAAMYWSKEEAKLIIREALDKGVRFDAIIAANDAIAEGIIMELRKVKQNGKVFVVGADGDASSVGLIRGREQHATVFQHPSEIAMEALRIASALANGNSAIPGLVKKSLQYDYPGQEIYVMELAPVLYDKENISELDQYWKLRKHEFE
ncbi:HTH-type transcriptional regulator YiaJ [compost metagenome]